MTLNLPDHVCKRIPKGKVEILRTALMKIQSIAERVPFSSHCYINSKLTIHSSQSISRMKHTYMDVISADILFDIHSILAAQYVLLVWRIVQLTEGLVESLNAWNLTVSAATSRPLVETACSFAIESRNVLAVWKDCKKRQVLSEKDIAQIRLALLNSSKQMIWGTRISKILSSLTADKGGIQRTNILTFVEKAEKVLHKQNLREDYEILCDAVHPSWGAGEIFWEEAGLSEDHLKQIRVVLNRNTIGQMGSEPVKGVLGGSRLSSVIFDCASWALETLSEDLSGFDRMCRDICLTARIYLMQNLDYFGIVKPTGPYDQCFCLSGKKTKFCIHRFGTA